MVINSSGYSFGSFGSFGSLASIRRQAEAITRRVEAESAARKAEQERTGLIKNPETGEMVEVSSVSEQERQRWEHQEQINSISPAEAYIMFSASDPHAEEIEQNKALAAKAAKIQDKMLAGKQLSGEEKSFLQEHYPALAAMASRMEQEAAQLEQKLQGSTSKEEARQIYMDTKIALMSGSSKEDSSILFLMAALDETFSQYMGRGTSSRTKIDIYA